ncbi:MFS transporter, aromatic acid:H+ symporter (AAHS) family [Serratia rubidaea]|uniref:MFS transporter, aromatic acid:H+ symporter (AAHS) family n=1 Tax=Serratia rubidaea TaxID=61652 RepID=A0A4U9HDF2_SERRU|nr:MFS transporter, aromatic acid:H+ symporter (AAHS) family [Serratia rubidaea]
MSVGTFNWERFRTLPAEIHLMLAGTLLTRGAYYMVWPFLAVLLYRQFHLSATAIGVLLAVATVCGALSGVYTGWLSDRFGRRRLILGGTTLQRAGVCRAVSGQSSGALRGGHRRRQHRLRTAGVKLQGADWRPGAG